jgi:hypothetical protein
MFAALTAKANTLSCSVSASIPGVGISGSCMLGSCTGSLSGGPLTVNGNCPGTNVDFSATGFKANTFVNIYCRGGSFSFLLPADNLSLNGTCSNGGSFAGSLNLAPGFINGNCSDDGPFSAFEPPSSANGSGFCTGGR